MDPKETVNIIKGFVADDDHESAHNSVNDLFEWLDKGGFAPEYNGHPSWLHWNIYLWVSNEEITYKAAMCGLNALQEFYSCTGVKQTPDGCPIHPKLLQYAVDCCTED